MLIGVFDRAFWVDMDAKTDLRILEYELIQTSGILLGLNFLNYHPPMKLWEGNVFKSVCLSMGGALQPP